jgi:hypothetical protein
MKLLDAAIFFGTQSKHLFNEKVIGDFLARSEQCPHSLPL